MDVNIETILRIGIIATKTEKIQNRSFIWRLITGVDYETVKISNWDQNSNLKAQNIELIIAYLPFQQCELDYSIRNKLIKEVNKIVKLFRKLEVYDVIASSACRTLFVSDLFLDHTESDNVFDDTDELNDENANATYLVSKSSNKKKINYDYREHLMYESTLENTIPLNLSANSMPFSVGFEDITLYDGRSVFINYISKIIDILSSVRNRDSRSCTLTIVDENLSDLSVRMIQILSKQFKSVKLMSFNSLKSHKLVDKYLNEEGLIIEIESDMSQKVCSDYTLLISNEFVKCNYNSSTIVIDMFGSFMGSNITIDNIKLELPAKIPVSINSLDLIELLLNKQMIVDTKKLKIKALSRNNVEISI